MLGDLSQDFHRCGATARERLEEFVFNPGMWAVLGYRFCRWVHLSRAPLLIKKPLNLVARCVDLLVRLTTAITLPASARIGPGLYIPHTGYIVVNSRTVIGSNCTLAQGVTLGHRGGGQGSGSGSPVIGNRVYIGPGAAVVGPITLGNDALIGVGAVVTRSVPERGVVAGNPARLLSEQGSFDLINYPGMEHDPDRMSSLAQRDEQPSGRWPSPVDGVHETTIGLGANLE
ncbi:MAG: serine O-acetyltransferase [Isosphaeraceae bacterium]